MPSQCSTTPCCRGEYDARSLSLVVEEEHARCGSFDDAERHLRNSRLKAGTRRAAVIITATDGNKDERMQYFKVSMADKGNLKRGGTGKLEMGRSRTVRDVATR